MFMIYIVSKTHLLCTCSGIGFVYFTFIKGTFILVNPFLFNLYSGNIPLTNQVKRTVITV